MAKADSRLESDHCRQTAICFRVHVMNIADLSYMIADGNDCIASPDVSFPHLEVFWDASHV